MTDPRTTPDLHGHEHAAEVLEQAALSGRLHHAWLFAGPPGVGKATLAWRFARWLLAGMPPRPPGAKPLHLDPDHPVFRRVSAGAHADVFTLEPGVSEKGVKSMIRAEDARAAIRFMAMTPAEGGWRVVVMDGAEETRRDAPNILLKTLEEPPPRAVLLLISSAPGLLLPTIRSRCRRLDLHPLDDAEMAPLLARALPEMPEAQRTALARLSGNAPGMALALAQGEGLALQALVEQCLNALSRPDPARAHAVADKLNADRTGGSFQTFMALLRRALAEAIAAAARGANAPPWLALRPLAEWSLLWQRIGQLAAETEVLNLDRKQAVLTGLAWLAARE